MSGELCRKGSNSGSLCWSDAALVELPEEPARLVFAAWSVEVVLAGERLSPPLYELCWDLESTELLLDAELASDCAALAAASR